MPRSRPGLAVSVLLRSSLRPRLRILDRSDGLPPLPEAGITLQRASREPSPLIDRLEAAILALFPRASRPEPCRMIIAALERDVTGLARSAAALRSATRPRCWRAFATGLVAAGVPLWRVASGAKLLHPQLDARGCRWLRGQGCVKEEYSRATVSDDNEEWLTSPFYHLVDRLNASELHRRLDGDTVAASSRYWIGSRTRAARTIWRWRSTMAARVARPTCAACCARSRPTGRAGSASRSSICCGACRCRCARLPGDDRGRRRRLTLVTTYLGADAGPRVLDGAIARVRPRACGPCSGTAISRASRASPTPPRRRS